MVKKFVGVFCTFLWVFVVSVKAEELQIKVVSENISESKESLEELITVDTEDSVDLYLKSLISDGMSDDFLSLVATIHFEAGPSASLESKIAVGTVVLNRLRNKEKWGYETLHDVIYADKQFSVVRKAGFEEIKEDLLAIPANGDAGLGSSFMAAYNLITCTDQYLTDPEIQYFYGSEDKRCWAGHTYCFTIGGNSFFK